MIFNALYGAADPVAAENSHTKISPSADVCAIAALMLAGALIRIPLPFTPVPVTLQTLVVLLAAFLVGPHRAAAGILLYLGVGLAGALGGISLFASLTWTTIGYLAVFPLLPYLLHPIPRTPGALLAGMIAATLILYAAGAGWLTYFLAIPLEKALSLGVYPFLPGDLIKLLIAAKIAERTARSSYVI